MPEKSLRWKLTEAKYKKLRTICLIACCLYIVYVCFLIKFHVGVNPEAYTYNPMTDPEPPMAKIQRGMYWIIGIGWLTLIILFAREVHKNPNHGFRKLDKKFNELDEDEEGEKEAKCK